MDYKIENIIEITRLVVEHVRDGDIDLDSFSYTELKDYIVDLSEKFEANHADSDWYELDYGEEITKFTNKALAKELWRRFGDVPMNPDTEEIEVKWSGFPAGTWREDIWRWFEETFNVSVAEDLMGMEDENNCSSGSYDCVTRNIKEICVRQNDSDRENMEKLWCFHIFEGDDGIIIADTKEDAEKKLKAEYPEKFEKGCESEYSIWNLIMDCSKSGDVIVTRSW